MRVSVEAWAPEYGAPIDAEALAPSEAEVDVAVELPVHDWRAIDSAAPSTTTPVVFVDGVRRIDARVWITGDDGTVRMGICASFAAGLVRCDGANARIVRAEVRRGLFALAGAPDLYTRAGTYRSLPVASEDIEKLSQGLQERMAQLEREVASAPLENIPGGGPVLVVLDGPLTAKLELRGAVGYIKTHRVAYLPPEVSSVVERLSARQRSPLFLTQGSWSRYSWYLRLAEVGGHAWAGIVRCEASADLPLEKVRMLADRTTHVLPRFASSAHKDPRAPQNLYPIAGLERELRRRMGDAAFVYRALRAAASH